MLKGLKCWKLAHVFSRNCAKGSQLDMKYLNVAEKNDAAKTIAGLLSNGAANRREGYSVYNKIYEFETQVKGQQSKMVMTSVSGHLLNLEFIGTYRRWNEVDPQALFSAPVRKSCPEDYQRIKRTLEREVRNCQGLIIWTDCDREGENIGYEIIDVCRKVKPNITIYRAVFSEITHTSVRRALQQLTQPNKRLSDAVDVRSELDLRTGAAITRFQTMRLQRLFPAKIADKLISYGSCQIPTLGFVAERYKEIEAFVSEPFWKLRVLHTIDDLTVDFNWARNRLFDKAACEDYLLLCLANPKAKVEEVTVKPKHKWRPTPLDTVEMEKLGSRKLKMAAKETMTIAEKLYSKGIISYPRTETNQFSKDINLSGLVEQFAEHSEWGGFAQRVMEWGPNPRNGSKSDQAHPPIHPTKLVTDLQGNDARVYELICRHFLACVSKDAVGSETIVHINIAGEKFTATGLCIYERNYLDIYIYDKWNAKQIHKYEQGQEFDPTEISMQEGATTAPPLLTEADLIALMEKHGIGTDATHAEHINTIKERGYIGVVDKGCLVPGIIGMGLYEGYDAMELALAKPMLRAEFELDLKKICSGEKDPAAVLREQIQKYSEAYKQITEKITAMDDKMALRINETPIINATDTNENANMENNNANSTTIHELFQCPKCNEAPLALRQKKNQTGHYLGCMNFPDCKNAIWLPDECLEPSVLSEACQHCGPTVKLFKFKFKSSYYKMLFKTPFGWYKTCLRCDQNFRNNFNINLEQVKRTGGIVGDVTSESATSTIGNTAPVGRSVSSSANTHLRGADGNTTECRKKKTKTVKTNNGSKTRGPTKNTTIETCATSQGIRTFFTPAAINEPQRGMDQQSSVSETIENPTMDDIALDDFLNSNDGFDEIIYAVEMQPTNAERNNISHHQNQNNIDATATVHNDNFRQVPGERQSHTTTTNFERTSEFGFDTTPPDLSDIAWGTAEHNRRASLNPSSSTAQQPHNRMLDTSTGASFTADQSPHNFPRRAVNILCTGCHQPAKQLIVKKDGPNKGKQFYVCSKTNPCKFFQWADEDSAASSVDVPNTPTRSNSHTSDTWGATTSIRTSPLRNEAVKCHCGLSASSLTVRKEGPNKGRPFYACPNRDSSCGFFKWNDQDSNEASTSSGSRHPNTSAWGTRKHSSRESSNENVTNRKRKCGLCRQEGHTRSKCPRKSEFEF